MDDQDFVMAKRRQDLRKVSHEEAEAILKLAGFTLKQSWELANGYWPDSPEYDEVRKPWWLFLTDIGPVQIGWRKRVLHIEWTACEVRATVTPDGVTKDERFVHAYTAEKAIEYLKQLRKEALRAREGKK